MQFSFRAAKGCLAIILVTILAAAAQAHGFKVGSLEIGHPFSRATLPGAKVAAGYLSVKNTGSEPDRLVSVVSEVAEKSEIHEMAVDSAGVMTMRPVDGGLEIPAGGELVLAPKGLHIMFVGLKNQVKEGEKFKGTLTFEKAGSVDVEFAVEAMGAEHDHSGG